MKEQTKKPKKSLKKDENLEKDNLLGYPEYPPQEDIYGKYHKERTINPDDPSGPKLPAEKYSAGAKNEKDFEDDVTGSDLDVPGSELDDELEFIGSEDEENNYYSLGGDNHNDLDEDHDEL
jgi:hypothetical protein